MSAAKGQNYSSCCSCSSCSLIFRLIYPPPFYPQFCKYFKSIYLSIYLSIYRRRPGSRNWSLFNQKFKFGQSLMQKFFVICLTVWSNDHFDRIFLKNCFKITNRNWQCIKARCTYVRDYIFPEKIILSY